MKPMNERLAWLAGILDGEGYLSATISSSKRKRSKGIYKKKNPAIWPERSLRFQIRIGNTDAAMIQEIGSISDSLGISYFVFSHKQRNPRAKEMFGIHFHGKERTKHLLLAVQPWLITKRPQAELLLEMIRRREEIPYHKGSLADPMLQEQLNRLRGLNHRGIVPDEVAVTVPDQFPVLDDPATRQESFPHDVVGGQQGAQYPHPTESASGEPSVGKGLRPRR